MASSDELATWGLEAIKANDYDTAARYFHQLRMQDSNHWAPTFMIRYCTAKLNNNMESMLGNLEQLNAALPETAAKIAPELTDNQTIYARFISNMLSQLILIDNIRLGLDLLEKSNNGRKEWLRREKLCEDAHNNGLEGLFLWLELLDRQLHNVNAIKDFLKFLFDIAMSEHGEIMAGAVRLHQSIYDAKIDAIVGKKRLKDNSVINILPEKYVNQIEDVVTRYNCYVEEWAKQKQLHAMQQQKIEDRKLREKLREERRKETEGYAEGKASTVSGLIAFVVFIIGKLVLFKGILGIIILVPIVYMIYRSAHSMLKKDYEKARQKYIETGEGNL